MREAPELQRTLRVGIGALVAVGGLAVATHHETAMTVEVSAVESPLVKQMGHLPVAECLLLQNVLALSCETPLPQETTTSTTTSTTTTLPPEIVKERQPKPRASRHISATPPPTSPSPGLSEASPQEHQYLGCISLYESTNNPTSYNPDGPYYGKYQFLQKTWDGFVSGIGRSDLVGVDIRRVNEATQDYVALQFLRAGRRGEWGPNRRCQRYLAASA